MSNPFENIPSSAEMPETIDKKTVTTLGTIADRLEKSTARTEAIVKNEEELAGVIFDTLLDDDGSIKDFGHSAEIRGMIKESGRQSEQAVASLNEAVKAVPSNIKVEFCGEDRKRLDSNFKSWKDVFQLHIPAFSFGGLLVGIILTGSIMLTIFASDTKREYEHRIGQLDKWYEDNADAIAFGQFYRENYPKQYRQWHTGQWQQDIAYRDSLRRAHSLDRLRRLYQSDD